MTGGLTNDSEHTMPWGASLWPADAVAVGEAAWPPLADVDEQETLRQRPRAAELDDGALVRLIQRIERRDPHALAALYDATSARIYGFVHRFLRRAAWTEEVVEDTFWQVWRQAPRFDGRRGRALNWLFAMARSRAIDALRREQRFQGERWAGLDGADEPTDERVHDLLELTRGAAQLREAVAALEPRARQLVALAFFRGLTHDEIAVHTGMPLGSVKSTIRRALQRLREHMSPSSASSNTVAP